jgi:hypothetical protein
MDTHVAEVAIEARLEVRARGGRKRLAAAVTGGEVRLKLWGNTRRGAG